MHLTFVTFNYQSADLEAEELNYLGITYNSRGASRDCGNTTPGV
jgi:hypothetical protein